MVHLPPVSDLALELEAIAALVRRLRPDWRDAEAFYEMRSEVIRRLMKLSYRVRSVPIPVPRVTMPLRPPQSALRAAAEPAAPTPPAPRAASTPRHSMRTGRFRRH
jgi:hypothetical protein